jgi:predicted membrane-bound dolichyl-phosphate-mannose-protein mannosyltransferase
MKLYKKIASFQNLLFVLAAGFVFRIVLSFFGTLELDFNTFIAWSYRLVNLPLSYFYKEWSDYLPGYLYILFVLGKIKEVLNFLPNEILYKLPAIFADLFSGVLVYKIVKEIKGEKLAFLFLILFIFNPAIFSNSSMWGQVDSLTMLFSLLSIYLFDKYFYLSAIILGFGASIKIQAALAVIPILFLFWKNKNHLKDFLTYGFVSFLTFVVVFLPFFPLDRGGGNFALFVIERIGQTLNQYPYTSVNAFNFWGLFGFWQPNNNFLPSFVAISALLFVIFLSLWKLQEKKGAEYLILALVFAVSFIFFPRMHERHLLPVFAPLIISSAIFYDLIFVYILFSIIYCLNLYYSFVWINNDFKSVFSDFFIKLLIIIELSAFSFWIKVVSAKGSEFYNFVSKKVISLRKEEKRKIGKSNIFPKIKISPKKRTLFLFLILLFAFASRVYRLNIPDKEYFDEVYHAFTAKIMLHQDPKAWEWWNPHPEGYAYEWSHPPLAKIGMQLGMIIFGENAFGWRFPAALLGTFSVLLVYLIVKEAFKDEIFALLSALTFSLDGLFLVMSRIGMNDAYVLFFSLLAIYLFLKDRIFFSSIAFGLALSSKWSALWVVPILFAAFFAFGKKFNFRYFWFFVLPPLVYVASYTQMFLTGHSFDIFIGVQKQMWWYHTGLEATHPYTSKWWSWPLLIRPIWLYTNSFESGYVANIYAFGNPIVFWFGLFSVIFSLYYAYVLKIKRLAWVVFSYLVFFVPWAVSPRIMFFYHYLPSIPFLAISIGFILRKNKELILPFLVFSFLALIYFYPHLIGLPIPRGLDESYYWFSSWR